MKGGRGKQRLAKEMEEHALWHHEYRSLALISGLGLSLCVQAQSAPLHCPTRRCSMLAAEVLLLAWKLALTSSTGQASSADFSILCFLEKLTDSFLI